MRPAPPLPRRYPLDFVYPAAAYPPAHSVPVSVVIHTRNEAHHLPYALASASWAKEVFVVDSESTDETQAIARAAGAAVVSRACSRQTLVAQRNWALATLPFATPWAFVLDADELVEPALAHEIGALLGRGAPDKDGFWLRWRYIFMGRWIKHASQYPVWSARLLRHQQVRYEDRTVNSHPRIAKGREGYLAGHLTHFDRRGLEAYLYRTIEFGRGEATEYGRRALQDNGSQLRAALWGRPSERRGWLKQLWMRLPARPLLTFLGLYLGRAGFLDGYPGLVHAAWRGFSELYTDVCRREGPQRTTARQAAMPTDTTNDR